MEKTNLNKKGEGSTLTWIAATVAVVVLVALFLIFTFVLTGQKIVSGDDEVVSGLTGGSKLSIQQDLFSYLNTKVEIDGESETIANVIYEYDVSENPAKRILDKAEQDFVLNTYPLNGVFDIKKGWIKVFDLAEVQNEIEGNKYSDFFSEAACDPRFPERSVFAEQVIGEKLVVLCVNPNYFEEGVL